MTNIACHSWSLTCSLLPHNIRNALGMLRSKDSVSFHGGWTHSRFSAHIPLTGPTAASQKHGGGGLGPKKQGMRRHYEINPVCISCLAPSLRLPTDSSETQQFHSISIKMFFITMTEHWDFSFWDAMASSLICLRFTSLPSSCHRFLFPSLLLLWEFTS